MARFALAALAFTVVAGCGTNPFVDGGSVTPTPVDPTAPAVTNLTNGVTIPAAVQGHVKAASFTPGDPTISLNITAQDGIDLNATYVRNAAFDVQGYTGYSYQETTSNRYVVALVAEVNGTKAMVAMDAGQFVNRHNGGIYSRADVFVAPTTGTTNAHNYSGSYAGLLNIGTSAPNGPGGTFDPTVAYRTQGSVLITADFVDMEVTGGIRNRSIVDTGEALADQFLWPSTPDSAGNFSGITKFSPSSTSGQYSGIFAGTDASEVAAVFVFTPYSGDASIIEQGLFVGSSCATAGGPACP